MSFQEPIGLGALDLTSVRVALAAIVWLQFLRRDAHLSGGPEPVGLARFGNFAFLEDRRRRTLLRVLSTAVAAAFAAGVALPLVAAWLALYVMTAGALISSHGGVLHSSQAVALAILAHASALVMNYGETGLWSGAPTPGSLAAQTTALAWSQQAFLAVYFTSGITKLNRSTWQWVRRSPYLLAPILKSIDEKYQERLDERARAARLRIVERFLRRPAIIRCVAAATLLLELGSPLILVNSWTTLFGGLSILTFHLASKRLLGLGFHSHRLLALALLVNPLLHF